MNSILITVDSFRADSFQALFERSHPTGLEYIRSTGTVFENAFTHGNWTPFAFPSIMSSKHVFTDGETLGPPDSPTIAEVLNDAGVRTAGYVAANGFLSEFWGYDKGFDAFRDYISVSDPVVGKFLATHPTIHGWTEFAKSLIDVRDRSRQLDISNMKSIENRVQKFIATTEGPFFLWIHLMDTHTPYFPGRKYVTDNGLSWLSSLRAHLKTGLGKTVSEETLEHLRSLYDATVRQIDDCIGRIVRTLQMENQAGETCLIIAGDHGEEFQEHGHLGHYPQLYDELIHVPFMINHPESTGRRIQRPVGLSSIPPTIADFMDVPRPDSWEGQNLARQVLNGTEVTSRPIVSICVRGDEITTQPIPRTPADGDLHVSVRTKRYVFIENIRIGEQELYDRMEDDALQENIIEEREQIKTRFSTIAGRHADRISCSDQTNRTVPPEVSDRLESLGYL